MFRGAYHSQFSRFKEESIVIIKCGFHLPLKLDKIAQINKCMKQKRGSQTPVRSN